MKTIQRDVEMNYDDINDIIPLIRLQIKEGIPYAETEIPDFDDPEEMFYWFKDHTKYVKDPHGIEMLQSIDSFFEDNYWGVSGYGDCDCFTIAIVTAMIAQGWKNISVYLVGRSLLNPVHIYAGIKWKGKNYIMDLTNTKFNKERHYPHKQKLKVKY